MVRSGNYEVDQEGNLVEFEGDGDAPSAARSQTAKQPTPLPVRRALRVYGFTQLVSFTFLIVAAFTKPEIRLVILILAVVYGIVAFGMHRLYRRGLMRRYASMKRRQGR